MTINLGPEVTRDLLIETLNAAILMIQLDLARLSEVEREHRRQLWAPTMDKFATRARRDHKEEGTAYTFNQLARGLAVLSFQPGGVTFLGRHWCVDHAACVRAERPPRTRAYVRCTSRKPLVDGRCPDCRRPLKRGHRTT